MATQFSGFPKSRVAASIISLLLVAPGTAALSQRYCSNQNTGSSGEAQSYLYQSNSYCMSLCGNGYAFAIVQGLNCWCSDYIPSNQVSVGSCDEGCPGYPNESCGNTARSLFGYIPLSKAPAGTIGASTSTPTVVNSVTVGRSVSASSSPPTTTPSTTSTPRASTSVTPLVTTVVNSVGSVVTITSTPTLPASNVGLQPTSKGIGGGVVAGIVVAVVIGLIILIGGFFFLWFRRYRRNRDVDGEGLGTGAPQRMNSQMSKNGLLGATAVPTFAFRRTTPPQTASSLSNGNTSPNTRRQSQPLFYDQRLNPQALMIHEDVSRNSINTIDDGRDYGRRLNVTNPDPQDRD